MAKRVDDIWSEIPGFPKFILGLGILLLFVGHIMSWFGNALLWTRIYTSAVNLGTIMSWVGMGICGAALIAGGLGASKE